MTLTQANELAYFSISLVSLAWHSWSLHQLRVGGIRGDFYRTVSFRVGYSVLYVIVGVNALWLHVVTSSTALLVFGVIQLTLIANSRIDVRHSHHPPYQPKHRYTARSSR